MTRDQSIVRRWFTWSRLVPPVEHFRDGRRSHPYYGLECDLDHLVTSVDSLGSGYLAGKPWDFTELAGYRTERLEQVRELLRETPVDADRLRVYDEYLNTTEELLQALSRVGQAAPEGG